MIGLILGIAAAVALGILITYAIKLTISWLRNKIKDKLKNRNTKKVAVGELDQMIASCTNQTSIDALDKLVDEGYTNVIASVDNNGQVEDVEAVKDTNDYVDRDVDNLINKTGEGMVVISG